MATTKPIYHRGYTIGNEANTIPAFKDAVARGCGFETDIRETLDHTLVCMHDNTWDKTTPYTGLIKETSQATVDTYHTNGGASIPSCLQALKIGAGSGPILLDKMSYGLSDTALLRVGELVKRFDMENRTYVFAGDLDFIAHFRELVPNVKVSYRPVDVDFNLAQVQAMGASAIQPDLDVMTKRRVAAYQDAGFKVFIQDYSINNADDLTRARNFGVDGVIIDADKWRAWT
jgi:glycerophosphoryl diester phosphodiesterase